MSPPRVLIVGGGVGGLALAQGLKKRNIDFAVFERDALLDSRLQGYRIKIFGDMEPKIRSLLTDEAWAEFEETCAHTNLGETTLNAPSASIIMSRRGHLPPGMPLPRTADRGMLRNSMFKGIENHVHFKKLFVRYEVGEDNEGVKVFFADGSVEHGTLLVGADGSRSAIRKQMLPTIKPRDTQACCIYGKTFLSPELLKSFPPQHRRWITVVTDQTPTLQNIISGPCPITLVSEQVVFLNREARPDLPQDYIHWGLQFPANTPGVGGPKFDETLKTSEKAAELSLLLTSEWDPSIRSLLELQEISHTLGMRIVSAGPGIGKWEPSANVTLMGDAIHVMSPSGGVGAVAALNDAFVLANIIEKGISAENIGRYENAMKEFSTVCINRSFLAGEKMLNMPKFSECKEVEW